ncbi:MAG: hypothetical protein MJ141_03600 [Clostridia bacterium]|nr:hypothetical protein [Clostridia bacterium]
MVWLALLLFLAALVLAVVMMTRWFKEKKNSRILVGVASAVAAFFLGLWAAVEVFLMY